MATEVKVRRDKFSYIKKVICPVCGSSRVIMSLGRGQIVNEILCRGCRVTSNVEIYLNDH